MKATIGIWLTAVYVIMSTIIGIFILVHGMMGAGCAMIFGCWLFSITGVRTKQIAFSENPAGQTGAARDLAIGAIDANILAILLAVWLGSKFAVQIVGFTLHGWQWGCIGFVLAFLWPMPAPIRRGLNIVGG